MLRKALFSFFVPFSSLIVFRFVCILASPTTTTKKKSSITTTSSVIYTGGLFKKKTDIAASARSFVSRTRNQAFAFSCDNACFFVFGFWLNNQTRFFFFSIETVLRSFTKLRSPHKELILFNNGII